MNPNSQRSTGTFTMQVTQTRDATIAMVRFAFDENPTFFGTAKRSHEDKFNGPLGKHLAAARALESMARYHRKQARIAENGGK